VAADGPPASLRPLETLAIPGARAQRSFAIQEGTPGACVPDRKRIRGVPSPGNPPITSSPCFVFSLSDCRSGGFILEQGRMGGGREGVLRNLTGSLVALGVGGVTRWGGRAVAELGFEPACVRPGRGHAAWGGGPGNGRWRSHQPLPTSELGDAAGRGQHARRPAWI